MYITKHQFTKKYLKAVSSDDVIQVQLQNERDKVSVTGFEVHTNSKERLYLTLVLKSEPEKHEFLTYRMLHEFLALLFEWQSHYIIDLKLQTSDQTANCIWTTDQTIQVDSSK